MSEQLFGIYELDNLGTVLYSRHHIDDSVPETIDNSLIGQNFFEKIGVPENAEVLRRHFRTFLTGTRSVDSFIFEGEFDEMPIKAKVLMTRGHETQDDSASKIVIMDIKRHNGY